MITIDEIKLIATERRGECLSEKFLGWKYKLKWKCEYEHEWHANLSNIKYGKWCPECGKKSRGLLRRNTLENMQLLANEKNGECLSEIYIESKKHLKWRCENNHIWEATPDNIKAGRWCPFCGKEKSIAKRRKTIEDMQVLAKVNGGKCNSVTYTNMNTLLEWECEKGHKWSALPSNIKSGKWCPYCRGRYRTIKDMQEFAHKKGGDCLSTEFISMTDKLQWKCAEGHSWESTPSSIFNSESWCPHCIGNKIKSIDYCKILAQAKGGACLSEEYKGIDEKMLWECTNGHRFYLTTYAVSKDSWCSICNVQIRNLNEEKCRFIFESLLNKSFLKTRKILENNLELDGFNEELNIAFEYNGVQHYEFNKYFHKDKRVFEHQIQRDEKKKLICSKKNISLITIPYEIELDTEKVEFIINELLNRNINLINKEINWSIFYRGYNPLEELIEIAKQKKGTCLSLNYSGVDSKLTWKCAQNHIWDSTPYQIKRGSWCPRCSGRQKTVEDMHELARLKEGFCLSTTYINNSTKLIWQCKMGHTWKATPGSIKGGTWCPTCNGNKEYSLEDMINLANERKGTCLSRKYNGFGKKLIWKCSENHEWEATPGSVFAGSWCKECLKPNIKEINETAKKYRGECLSASYIDSKTKMLWRCEKGHVWESIFGNINRGRWCPQCSVLNKEQEKTKKIIELQEIARSRGGICLSQRFENVDAKMKWQCEEGHVWQSSAYSIKSGAWCRKCANKRNADNRKGSIEEMHKIAFEKEGKCLSKSYENSQTPLEWQCSSGHRWMSTANSIKSGSWCRVCSIKRNSDRQRKNIKDMRKLAASREGECLSIEYINAHTKLTWKCSEGHVWEAKPNNIQQGKWCRKCKTTKKSKTK